MIIGLLTISSILTVASGTWNLAPTEQRILADSDRGSVIVFTGMMIGHSRPFAECIVIK